MPGYGFAQAPKSQVDDWTRLVFDYLRGRPNLRRVYLLIDSRHGLKKVDTDVLDLLDKAAVSYQIVLTKADKIAREETGKPVAAMVAATAEGDPQAPRRPSGHPGDLVRQGLGRRDAPLGNRLLRRLNSSRRPTCRPRRSPKPR